MLFFFWWLSSRYAWTHNTIGRNCSWRRHVIQHRSCGSFGCWLESRKTLSSTNRCVSQVTMTPNHNGTIMSLSLNNTHCEFNMVITLSTIVAAINCGGNYTQHTWLWKQCETWTRLSPSQRCCWGCTVLGGCLNCLASWRTPWCRLQNFTSLKQNLPQLQSNLPNGCKLTYSDCWL